jgi:hypothetical protein
MIEVDVKRRRFLRVPLFAANTANAFCSLFRQDMPVANWIFKSPFVVSSETAAGEARV